MSYNIRIAPCVKDDDTENAWVYRLPKIIMLFNHYKPDISGMQEISFLQMRFLQASSTTVPYTFLGKYPKKSTETGLEIMYNPQKLRLLSDLRVVWLNEAQDIPGGPAWDSSFYQRYVIYAKFTNRATGNAFWFLTTHFDHLGVRARQESAKIVIDLAASLDAPAVITGDFNCFPKEGGRELYQLLCTRCNRVNDAGATARKVFGVPGTWIGWDYDPYKLRDGYAKYDYLFVENWIEVLQQGVIDDQVWDPTFKKALYPSDHRPVLGDLKI